MIAAKQSGHTGREQSPRPEQQIDADEEPEPPRAAARARLDENIGDKDSRSSDDLRSEVQAIIDISEMIAIEVHGIESNARTRNSIEYINYLNGALSERAIAALSGLSEIVNADPPRPLSEALVRSTSEDTMTNVVDAKIAAAEARTDAKFVEMKGQLALVLEAVKESRHDMGEVQSELRSARSTYVVTAIASVIAIGGLVVGLLAYGGDQFGRGAEVSQVVDSQIDRKLDSLYELVNKALIEQRTSPPVRQ